MLFERNLKAGSRERNASDFEEFAQFQEMARNHSDFARRRFDELREAILSDRDGVSRGVQYL